MSGLLEVDSLIMIRLLFLLTLSAGLAALASAQDNSPLPIPDFRPSSPRLPVVAPFPAEVQRSPVLVFDGKNNVFYLTVSTDVFEFYELEESQDLKAWSAAGGKIRGNGSLRTFQFRPEEMASFFLRIFRS
ncbi:MAG: hypothetical protein AAF514_11675 [Verrucomicrobiota bacterium]